MNTLTASVAYNRLIRKAQAFMWRHGFLSPLVCVGREGAPVPSLLKHEAILVSDSDVEAEGCTGLYRAVYMIRLSGPENQGNIDEIARLAANEEGVCVAGCVAACLYKRYQDKRPESLEMDPEAQTLLHGCFYIKGDTEPHVVQLPYMDRGEIKTSPAEEEEVRHDINFMNVPWEPSTVLTPPKIIYPFND